jgi:hypothetical protein
MKQKSILNWIVKKVWYLFSTNILQFDNFEYTEFLF